MAKYSVPITVCRDDRWVEIKSEYLVPGDLIEVPQQVKMPCDAVLIEGQSVVNEAMLTGESVPVLKVSINRNEQGYYDMSRDKKYTLFSGTEVVKTRSQNTAKAIVSRTGFSTTKGLLVKAILFPRPTKFHFMRESLIFAFGFGCIALIGVVSLIDITIRTGTVRSNILRWCDLITIAIPPALPLAMTTGIVQAIYKLRKKKIFCIDPP